MSSIIFIELVELLTLLFVIFDVLGAYVKSVKSWISQIGYAYILVGIRLFEPLFSFFIIEARRMFTVGFVSISTLLTITPSKITHICKGLRLVAIFLVASHKTHFLDLFHSALTQLFEVESPLHLELLKLL